MQLSRLKGIFPVFSWFSVLAAAADVDVREGAQWWEFMLWGMAGGMIVDGLAFVRLVRGPDSLSDDIFSTPQILGFLVRLLIGGILATAMGLANDISAPLGALLVGMMAPIIIDRFMNYGDVSRLH